MATSLLPHLADLTQKFKPRLIRSMWHDDQRNARLDSHRKCLYRHQRPTTLTLTHLNDPGLVA